ncbi:MAG TPA: F0F1 ATP synthase subunit alpha, partial [Petrimonas sp.]|nr:F0F1 ATP synthase subunit alpha [Petrimonas sp.]
CGTKGLLTDVPLEKVSEFEKKFLHILELNHRTDVLDELKKGVLNDVVTNILETVAADTKKQL